MKKDLLRIDTLSKDQILDILNLADQLKYEQKHGIEHPLLKGKTLGMIFEKSSTKFTKEIYYNQVLWGGKLSAETIA